jgi:phenylpyruvate tautomerase PptA (4-oxalocrotonate tautomerase family)
MPLIDLTLPSGALDRAATAELVQGLTAALIQHEGAPDNERTRAMTWVLVHELPPGTFHVGGTAVERPVYRVAVTVPEGTLLHGPGPFGTSGRSSLVRDVTDLVLSAEGGTPTASDRGRVYCTITEIKDGYWGALGETITMTDIASIAGGDAETELGRRARDTIDALLAERVQT